MSEPSSVAVLTLATRSRKRDRMSTRLTLLALSSTLLTAGCGSKTSSMAGSMAGCSAATATATNSVSLKNVAFSPTCIKIAAGSTVIFTNQDVIAHTVYATDRSFDSGPLKSNAIFQHPFVKAGTFAIGCNYHPDMMLTVIAQ